MNTPNIRFKGYTDDWEKCTLKNITERIIVGLATSVTPYYRDKGTPLLRNMNIKENHLDDSDILYLDEAYANNNDSKKIHTDDVLTVHTGANIGLTCLAPQKYDGCLSFTTLITTPKKDILDSGFLMQYMNSNKGKNRISAIITAGGKPNLNSGDLEKLEVYYPSLLEQKSISAFLLKLDNLIILHQRKRDEITSIKKYMLQKMFPKQGEKVPEIRFPGFTGDWGQRKLGELGTTYSGLSGKSSIDFGHGEGRFITYMNVYKNPVADADMLAPIEIDQKQKEVEIGDVFFTTSSETPDEVGMSSVLLEKHGHVYLNSFCFGYRPVVKFDSYYLAYMLRSDTVRKKIVLLAQGISRYNISKNKMMEITIPMPNMEEQENIGAYFKNLDTLITLHQQECEKYKELKKGLLQQLFI